MNYKEDEGGLPDLPPLKTTLPRIPKPYDNENSEPVSMKDNLESERHALPSFPDSPIKKGFSQMAIKEAISTKEDELPPLPELPEEKEELKEYNPSISIMNQKSKLPNSPPPQTTRHIPLSSSQFPRPKNEDIYVKIDRFHSAKKTLKASKEKIDEIETLLRRIKETKIKEEQELESWEREIAEVKEKISNVISNIFEKA